MKILRLLLFLLASPLWAQADKITDSILQQSNVLVFSDISKGERHAQFVLQNQPRGEKAALAFLVLADAAYLRGDFETTVKNLSSAQKSNPSNPTMILVELYLAHYYRIFGFKELSFQHQNRALKMLKEIPQQHAPALWARYYWVEAGSATDSEMRLAALHKGESNLRQNKIQPALFYQIQVALGSVYAQLKNEPMAERYLGPLVRGRQNVFKAQALLVSAMADQSAGRAVSEKLFAADRILESCTDVPTRSEVYKGLSENFLKAGNAGQYKLYLEKYQALDSQIKHQTKVARDSVIAHLERSGREQAQGDRYYFIAVAVLLLLLGYGLYVYNKTRQDYRKFLKAIEKPMAVEVQQARAMAIPQKTEEALLEKLSKFEKSGKFTNPNLTIQALAKSLDTNTKYLSEVINRNKNANFNQYLNELRISYIIGKMKEDPKYLNYKIYYLAKESGFASQNTFSTVFKAATGISPLSFIKFLKNEKLS